jgi:predicted GNAT family acetyltransferase
VHLNIVARDEPHRRIVRDSAHDRLVWTKGDREAELVYRRRGNRLILVHTGVPEALSGQGIAGDLVRAAIEWAELDHLTVVPICPYARKWLSEHPEAATNIKIHWSCSASRRVEDSK